MVRIKEHTMENGVHTFLVDGDIKLVVRNIKPDKYGDIRAKVEAWCGEKQVCDTRLKLEDDEASDRFDFYARKRGHAFDWVACLMRR
jgi:hypothetical protein